MICDKYDVCEFAGDTCDVSCLIRAARIHISAMLKNANRATTGEHDSGCWVRIAASIEIVIPEASEERGG